MLKFRLVCITLLLLILSACIKAHRIDIQQGNLVTDAEIAQLTPGMTKREVRYILGTPLVIDPFHENRWDYFYSLDVKGEEKIRRRITIVFEDDLMKEIEGNLGDDSTPGSQEENSDTVIAKPAGKEKGFFKRTWDKIRGRTDNY